MNWADAPMIYFASRGAGLARGTQQCFMCEALPLMCHELAGFVKTREQGEAICMWLVRGAWLDFRAHEPDYIQVKIDACHAHLPNLQLLDLLTRKSKSITKAIIDAAISGDVITYLTGKAHVVDPIEREYRDNCRKAEMEREYADGDLRTCVDAAVRTLIEAVERCRLADQKHLHLLVSNQHWMANEREAK